LSPVIGYVSLAGARLDKMGNWSHCSALAQA
jgi:hypothetical protein